MKIKYILILLIVNFSIYAQNIDDVVVKGRSELFKINYEKAENGDAKAQYDLGQMYHYGVGTLKDSEKAIEWYEKSANQGNLEGMFALANSYYAGDGVKQNLKKALELYTQCSEKENYDATFNLANMYFYGQGTKINLEISLDLYKLCAENEDLDSQTILGMMYYNGIGTKKDIDKAKVWLLKASEKGHEMASKLLEEIKKNKQI